MTPEQESRQTVFDKARHLNISSNAERAYDEIYDRWDKLGDVKLKDGSLALDHLSSLVEIRSWWTLFKERWIHEPDLADLGAAGSDLHVAEGRVHDLLIADGQSVTQPPQVKVPDVVSGEHVGSGAEKIDEGVKKAEHAIDSIPDLPSSVWASIPISAKIGAAVVATITLIAAVRK